MAKLIFEYHGDVVLGKESDLIPEAGQIVKVDLTIYTVHFTCIDYDKDIVIVELEGK